MFKKKKCTKLKAGSRIAVRKKNTEENICPGPDQPVLAKLCSDVIVPWGRRVFGARQKMFSNAQLARPLKQEISTFLLCFYCETLDPRPQRRKTEIQMFGHNCTEFNCAAEWEHGGALTIFPFKVFLPYNDTPNRPRPES